MNPLTEDIFYVDYENRNLRMVISAPLKMPIVWKVSKVEGSTMGLFGLMRLTFAQDVWNTSTDYIDLEAKKDGDLFAMYADYYSSTVEPVEKEVSKFNTFMELSCYNNKIKNGGSYKLITSSIFDTHGIDVTSDKISLFSSANWTCSIDGVDFTNSSLITWLPQAEKNKMKIKFGNDRTYLTKILKVSCSINDNGKDIEAEFPLEISAL